MSFRPPLPRFATARPPIIVASAPADPRTHHCAGNTTPSHTHPNPIQFPAPDPPPPTHTRQIAYRIVEVNPLTKEEIKGKFNRAKVPVVIVEGEGGGEMHESDEIINQFESLIAPKAAWFGGKNAKALDEEERWRKWVRESYVHVLTVNIYRTARESLETFDYISKTGNFPFWSREGARYSGAGIMYLVSKLKIMKKHKIENEREALYETTKEWVAAIDGRDFMGGKEPNLADLSVFGVLRAIEKFESFRDMLDNTDIGPWYARMQAKVGESAKCA